VTERVLLTPRGPIVSPAFAESPQPGRANAISMAATWLSARPYTGLLRVHRARSFDECRELFRAGSGSTVCVVWADANDTIGSFLGVELRDAGSVTACCLCPAGTHAWAGRQSRYLLTSSRAWSPRRQASSALPTTNRCPRTGTALPRQRLVGRLPQCHAHRGSLRPQRLGPGFDSVLQRDLRSPIWPELRARVLATRPRQSDSLAAQEILRPWDGRLAADSVGASVFSLFLVELGQRVVRSRAPRAAAWALGRGPRRCMTPTSSSRGAPGISCAWCASRPRGSCPRGSGHRRVPRCRRRDPAPERRPRSAPLGLGAGPAAAPASSFRQALADLGPFQRRTAAGAGDATTVAQQAVDWRAPLANPVSVPMVRAVIDVGGWENCRFVLVAGRSAIPSRRTTPIRSRSGRAARGCLWPGARRPSPAAPAAG